MPGEQLESRPIGVRQWSPLSKDRAGFLLCGPTQSISCNIKDIRSITKCFRSQKAQGHVSPSHRACPTYTVGSTITADLHASGNKSQVVFGGQSTDAVSIKHASEPEWTSRLANLSQYHVIFIFLSSQYPLKIKVSELLNLSVKIQM